MPGDFPALDKQELFIRLAQGEAAGISVVTPNRRLAQALRSEFDDFQAGKELPVWEDADILPLDSFIERIYEDAHYDAHAGTLPRLLSAAQERALWESVLADAPLLSVAETAAHCAKAWRLAQAWRIAGALEKFPGNDDTRAFAGWARAFAKRCKQDGLVSFASLVDLILERQIRRPKLLVAYGFDILPPQAGEFLAAFCAVPCDPDRRTSGAQKIAFPAARHELEAAAQWARARLAAGIEGGKSRRIGVVVPDLQTRRKEVVRVFSDVMRPGWNLPGAGVQAMPFDISIGAPLDGYPVVAAAMSVLELCGGEIPFEHASQLILSPFVGGADTECAARALLDARLRETLPPRLTLPKLIASIEGCALLRSRLELLYGAAKEMPSKTQSPHDWARHFTGLLEAAGFPGERALDSDEFQARAKFNEILGEFSRLSFLSGKIPIHEALRQLRRLCAETLFQPETPAAPVEVLGILESAGLAFDCLWVSGLTEEAWPLAARANPFLPVALQRKAGIPEAAAETSLALDRRITDGWLGAAREVVFSYPQKDEDRDLLPSPLIAQVTEGAVDLPFLDSYRELIFKNGKTETYTDEKALHLDIKTVRGGTRVLADQAACPFRAFARHRLGAEGLDAPSEGPDAMQRGQLLHALMAGIWREVKTKDGLDTDISLVISRSAEKAVRELEIEGRFAELEKQRLVRLARDWLAVERGRSPFEVIHVEQKRNISLGGLEFSGRIDRMDRLDDGSHAIIDYKTGSRATPNDWLGERPAEPQLPLYVVCAAEDVSAVAFAKLKPGAMKFAGFSLREKALPGVKPARSWPGLVQYWKKELEGLARGFARGDARVDPKNGLATCRNCDLQPLCRVHERGDPRLNPLADADGEEE